MNQISIKDLEKIANENNSPILQPLRDFFRSIHIVEEEYARENNGENCPYSDENSREGK